MLHSTQMRARDNAVVPPIGSDGCCPLEDRSMDDALPTNVAFDDCDRVLRGSSPPPAAHGCTGLQSREDSRLSDETGASFPLDSARVDWMECFDTGTTPRPVGLAEVWADIDPEEWPEWVKHTIEKAQSNGPVAVSSSTEAPSASASNQVDASTTPSRLSGRPPLAPPVVPQLHLSRIAHLRGNFNPNTQPSHSTGSVGSGYSSTLSSGGDDDGAPSILSSTAEPVGGTTDTTRGCPNAMNDDRRSMLKLSVRLVYSPRDDSTSMMVVSNEDLQPLRGSGSAPRPHRVTSDCVEGEKESVAPSIEESAYEATSTPATEWTPSLRAFVYDQLSPRSIETLFSIPESQRIEAIRQLYASSTNPFRTSRSDY